MFKKIIVSLGFILTTLAVHAEEKKASLGLLLGSTSQEVEGDSGDDTAFGIRGAYQVNENVALEMTFLDHGKASYSYIDIFGDTINESADTSAFNFGMKGVLPIENKFALVGRFGISIWDTSIRITDSSLPGQVFTGDDSGNDFYFGIGAQYQVNEKLSLGVEYTLADYDVEPGGNLSGLTADLELRSILLSASTTF